jgi:primary-amine oxidase
MLARLKQINAQFYGLTQPPHPFDPLTTPEIEYVIAIVSQQHSQLRYNAVTLSEPRKKEMLAWLDDPGSAARPKRQAEVVAIDKSFAVYDGIVDLTDGKILLWEKLEDTQPVVSLLFRFFPGLH